MVLTITLNGFGESGSYVRHNRLTVNHGLRCKMGREVHNLYVHKEESVHKCWCAKKDKLMLNSVSSYEK